MRTLMVDFITSLDGYAAAEGWPGWWGLVVFPVVTGVTCRERIYDGYPDVALDLVEARTFDGRLQLLEFVPTVLDGPPAGTRTST